MIALLLTLIFAIPQEPKIATCTVTSVKKGEFSIRCNDSLKRSGTYKESDEVVSEWLWAEPTSMNAVKLSKRSLRIGDVVKVEEIDRQLYPLAGCEVRRWRQGVEWMRAKSWPDYDRAPFSVYTPPRDCVK